MLFVLCLLCFKVIFSPSYGSIPTKESFNDFYNDAPPVHSSSNGDSKRENTNSAPVAKPRRLNVRRNTESTSNTQSITTPVQSEKKTPRIQSHSTIGEVITRPAELFIPPPPPLETHFEISEQNSAKILTDRGDTPVKERIEQLKVRLREDNKLSKKLQFEIIHKIS